MGAALLSSEDKMVSLGTYEVVADGTEEEEEDDGESTVSVGSGAGVESAEEGAEAVSDGEDDGAASDEDDGGTSEDVGEGSDDVETAPELVGDEAAPDEEAVDEGAGADPPPALKTAGPGATNSDWSPPYRFQVRKSVLTVYASGKLVRSELEGAAVPSEMRLIWTQYG